MISVILPSMGRASQLLTCVDQLLATFYNYIGQLEVVIVIDEDHVSRDAVMNQIADDLLWKDCVTMVYREHGRGPMAAWNDGLKASSGDIIVLGADDLWFTVGWLEAALDALATLPDSDGLVGLNDGANIPGRDYATHWLCTRRWIAREQHGCLVVPLYQRQYIDPEACLRAQISGRYVYAEAALVQHRHHLWGLAEHDWTYQQNTPEIFEADRALFEERAAQGFPNNFPPAIQIPQVYWAVPRERSIMCEATMALERVAMHNAQRGYLAIQSRYTATDAAREGFTREFLRLSTSPDDWLVQLDSDHEHPDDICTRLTQVGNVGVVGALCRRRGDELDALLFKRNPETNRLDRIASWPEGELVQVDAVGSGAIAIRRWVFDKLHEKHPEQKYWMWRYAYDDNSPERPGEEIYFCGMCEEAGIPMCCHTGVNSPHLIVLTVEKVLEITEAAGRGENWKALL